MAKNLELNVLMGAKLAADFMKSTKAAAGAFGDIEAAAKKTQKVTKNIYAFKASRDAFNKLGEELKQAQEKYEKIQASMLESGADSEKLTKQLEKQRKEIDKLTAAQGRYAEVMKKWGKKSWQKQTDEQLERTAVYQEMRRRAGSAIRGAGRGAAYVGSGIASSGGIMREAAGSAMSAGLALTPAVMASVQWEQSLAQFNKVADLSPSELEKVSAEVRKKAKDTGTSRTEIIKAMASAAQAGYKREEWGQFADLAIKAGIGLDVGADEAGTMIKALRSSLGLDMAGASQLLDVVNYLSNTTESDATKIVEALMRQGSMLKTAGFSTTESAGLMTAGLMGGLEADVVATSMRNFAEFFALGSTHTKARQQEIDSLGVGSATQLQSEFYADRQGTIMKVLNAIQKVEPEKRMAKITALFGKEGVTAIAPLVDQVGNLQKAWTLANDEAANGSLQKEADVLGTTSLKNINRFKESLIDTATAIGDSLVHVLTEAMRFLKPFLEGVSTVVKENPSLVKGILAGAAAFKVLNLVMNRNPLGVVVTALAAIVGYMATVMDKTPQLAASIKKIADVLRTVLGGVLDGIALTLGKIINGVEWVIDKFSDNVDDYEGLIKERDTLRSNGDMYSESLLRVVEEKIAGMPDWVKKEYEYRQKGGNRLNEAMSGLRSGLAQGEFTREGNPFGQYVAPVFNVNVKVDKANATPEDISKAVSMAQSDLLKEFERQQRLAYAD